MIRDPSDGSVREEINHSSNEINRVVAKTASKGITSGLAPTETDRATRLQKSRDWLKSYQARKGK